MQNPCFGKYLDPRGAYFPIHPSTRQRIVTLALNVFVETIGQGWELMGSPRKCLVGSGKGGFWQEISSLARLTHSHSQKIVTNVRQADAVFVCFICIMFICMF